MERIDPNLLVKYGGIGTCSKAASALAAVAGGRVWHQLVQVFMVLELIVVVEVRSRGEVGSRGQVSWSLLCMESLSLHRGV